MNLKPCEWSMILQWYEWIDSDEHEFLNDHDKSIQEKIKAYLKTLEEADQ